MGGIKIAACEDFKFYESEINVSVHSCLFKNLLRAEK